MAKVKMKKRNSLILAFLIVLMSFYSLLMANDLDDQVRVIAHKLRCPTCQGLSVKESEAGLAVNMKKTIRKMLVEGKTEAEVLNFFELRYGEWILRSPKKSGFNLLLWLLPGLLIIIAIIVLFLFVRKKSFQNKSQGLKPLDDKEKQLIEKEMDDLTNE